MGRIVIPIGIDLEAVKKVFGSKDVALFNNLLQSEFYKKFDEEFSFKRELHDLIFNYVPLRERIVKPSRLFGLVKGNNGRGLEGEWNDYGYALLTLCCYLGEKFSENDKEFIYGDHWWKINTLLREKGSSLDLSRMLETQQVFDTPFEQDDIYTNCYTKAEVREFLACLAMDENVIEQNSELFRTLKKGLQYCEENNLDVVIFSHEFGDLED